MMANRKKSSTPFFLHTIYLVLGILCALIIYKLNRYYNLGNIFFEKEPFIKVFIKYGKGFLVFTLICFFAFFNAVKDSTIGYILSNSVGLIIASFFIAQTVIDSTLGISSKETYITVTIVSIISILIWIWSFIAARRKLKFNLTHWLILLAICGGVTYIMVTDYRSLMAASLY